MADGPGIMVNATPYPGVDYTTRKNESQSKQLSRQGQQRVAAEDLANRGVEEAAAANLRPLGAENPVQQEEPFLPDGTENPAFNWSGAPQADRPSYAESQDIEAQKQAIATQQAKNTAPSPKAERPPGKAPRTRLPEACTSACFFQVRLSR